MATTCMSVNGSGATNSSRGLFFQLKLGLIPADPNRHNVAPRSQAPVLRRRDPGEAGSADDLVLQTMRWGLVPHWSKHEDKTLNTTNARREQLVEGGGMWQSIKGKRRCAVLCEGSVRHVPPMATNALNFTRYYEWLKKGKERLPHFTKRKDGQLMLLAGLYDHAHLEGQLATFEASCDALTWPQGRANLCGRSQS